jgi:hypothetical protein
MIWFGFGTVTIGSLTGDAVCHCPVWIILSLITKVSNNFGSKQI